MVPLSFLEDELSLSASIMHVHYYQVVVSHLSALYYTFCPSSDKTFDSFLGFELFLDPRVNLVDATLKQYTHRGLATPLNNT